MLPNDSGLSIHLITQATRATFTDMYFHQTFLSFIHKGTKKVICPHNGELIGSEGDLFIFPPGSIISLENRPLVDADYQADGVSIANALIDAVYADQPVTPTATGIQVVRGKEHKPEDVLALMKETLANTSLPEALRQHRLLEPLIWLRHIGVHLSKPDTDNPLSKVRSLIETDLSYAWRATDVASHFAMSEATFRRWLAKSGHGFAKVLLHTRLEKGLALLQSTHEPISNVALDCGFNTPSHFSEAFKKRFGIRPKEIRSREV
ncbi:AraC family transcriptional regulator [Pseudovibrio sp. FO-BEG1]|uniref:helix-turn-helix transcriptional regulator n=1 Tax=Pseudovibrio sp. (strain FO-BEG1) TaxID=911045 RepID=UPI0005A0BBD5|nr:AraC family transcriptional regulator [Pseudovibrio sp. FO-BEG1]